MTWVVGMAGIPLVLGVALWQAQAPAPAPEPVVAAPPPVAWIPDPGLAADAGRAIAAAPPAQPEAQAITQAPPAPAAPAPKEWETDFAKGDLAARIDGWTHAILQDEAGFRSAMASALPPAPATQDVVPLLPPKFDCTTFVETVAALASSRGPDDFYAKLLAIRYKDGRADFASRNHFPEADWIPNNAAAGLLDDVTAEVAAAAKVTARFESKKIDRAAWLKERERKGEVSRAIASESGTASPFTSPPAVISLRYIPVESVEKAAARIPSGSILNVVRSDRPRQPVLVTHQGIVIQKDGKTWLRHSLPTGKLRTVELTSYLQNLEKEGQRSWPVLGFNLNRLR